MADRLSSNQTLTPGQEIRASDGRAFLVMQGDGNLVLYEVHGAKNMPVWASKTSGAARAVMQGDGNLVVYNSNNQPIWASNTGKPGAYLVIQDDGNAVVYASGGDALWASNTMRQSRKVAFDPAKHGFRFSNDSFRNKVATLPGLGNFETFGRCGGMAYAALDYYYSNIPVPTYTKVSFSPSRVPPDGHWLADYIYVRLMNSFSVPSATRFPEWTGHADHQTWFYKGVTKWTKEEEFPKLRARIDGGDPAALGLVAATNLTEVGMKNHQVVAYGYDYHPVAQTMTVYVYDNSYPGEEVTLTSEPGNPHFTASSGRTRRGFFVQDYAHKHPPVYTAAPPADGTTVKYGVTVKVSHLWTGRTLHSHAHNYGHIGSSGQQQVTAFEGADDNDLWRIKGPHGQPENHKAGHPVQHGEVVRLQHVLTGRNLHSHSGHPSPVTKQQEVTCFGQNGIGDSNDNWRVEVDGEGEWSADRGIRLVHQATNHTLHSHLGHLHPKWTAGQQEVTGFANRDDNDRWCLLEVR